MGTVPHSLVFEQLVPESGSVFGGGTTRKQRPLFMG